MPTSTSEQPIVIMRSLTVDDIMDFRSVLDCIGAAQRRFTPGMQWIATQDELGPHRLAAVWAARNGYPKALALVAIREDLEHGAILGDVTVSVHRDYRQQGLASAVLDKLRTAYPVDFSKQICTPEGAEFLASYLTKRGIRFVERYQTPEEFADRCMTRAVAYKGPYCAIVRRLLIDFAQTNPQHSIEQLTEYYKGPVRQEIVAAQEVLASR